MTLIAQCGRLDEANRAWQQYHQDEFDSFRDKLRKNLPVDSSQSLGDAADAIIAHLNQMKNEQDGLEQRLQTSDKLNQDLRLSKKFVSLASVENIISPSLIQKPSMMIKLYNRTMVMQSLH